MSELMAEIGAGVKQFLDNDRTDVQRSISRTAILNSNDVEIEIEQCKMLTSEDAVLVRTEGPKKIANLDWFNDVEWIKELVDSNYAWLPRRKLLLDATYPMEYFDEDPGAGHYSGDNWLDQYGSISSFGSRDAINLWLLRFVAPDSHVVTELRHPDDPTALEQYNARYQQYLSTLNDSDSTLSYYRGWDRHFSHDADKTSLALGGLSLSGVGATEILEQGMSTNGDLVNGVRILLTYVEPFKGYVGRDLTIIDDSIATTEPIWDGEDEIEDANEELLSNALKLIQDLNKNNL